MQIAGRGGLMPPDPMRRNLVELCWLRGILAGLLLLTALYCQLTQAGELRWPWGLVLVFALLLLLNALTWLRLRSPREVEQDELFLQLLFDLLLLTMLFRLSGGSSNPFVTYYLVALAIAATTLSRRQTGVLAVLMLLAYSALFWWPPAPMPAGGVQWPWDSYHGHLLGMWVNFTISALLLVFFLGRMHLRLRQRDRYLAEQQRRLLQRDQAVAMGTLAATAVHELATPLATLTLLAEELEQDSRDAAALAALQVELRRCREILSALREQARRPEALPPRPLREHLQNCVQPLQVRYPQCEFVLTASEAAAPVSLPWLLQQVIHNGLDNAAAAARSRVEVALVPEGDDLRCLIRDDGAGFPDEALRSHARPVASSKRDGLGLGLFLGHVTVTELGGSLALRNLAGGGAELDIRVPLARLAAVAEED